MEQRELNRLVAKYRALSEIDPEDFSDYHVEQMSNLLTLAVTNNELSEKLEEVDRTIFENQNS